MILQETGALPSVAVFTADLPEAQAEQTALARALDQALARIRPEYCEAVVLRSREDLSVEEVAEIMSLPSGTVKTHLYRARKESRADSLGPWLGQNL